MLDTIITKVTGFVKQPFRQEGTMLDWVLFLGFVACVGVFWSQVMRHIKEV